VTKATLSWDTSRVPVAVEATLDLIVQVVGPNGGQGAQAARGLDVADDADHNHGGRLDDRHGLDSLLLVELGAGLVDVTQDVGHTRLVANKGGQVRGLGGVVLGEGLDCNQTRENGEDGRIISARRTREDQKEGQAINNRAKLEMCEI
jgi:hypothetical protein